MYKDKEKQKQAQKERTRRYRDKQKGVTSQGVTGAAVLVRVTDQVVYGRPAVSYYRDKFETRPEPLDVTDRPHSGGRGRYTRQDGTVYQFDCAGHSPERKHPFKDKYGKERLAIYKDLSIKT